MEEYGLTILYHTDKKNVIANTFSWLLHCDVLATPVGEKAPVVLFDFTPKDLNIRNNPDLLKCFLNLPLPSIAESNLINI